MPFVKGQSGNPKGKAKIVLANGMSLRDMARTHTETALKALIEVVTTSESDTARIGAATALLDRGWGRPAQAVELTGANGGPIQTQALDTASLSEAALREVAGAQMVGETLQ